MNELPHLGDIFDRLKRGSHLGPDDEPLYSALTADPEAYARYFAPLGLELIHHERPGKRAGHHATHRGLFLYPG